MLHLSNFQVTDQNACTCTVEWPIIDIEAVFRRRKAPEWPTGTGTLSPRRLEWPGPYFPWRWCPTLFVKNLSRSTQNAAFSARNLKKKNGKKFSSKENKWEKIVICSFLPQNVVNNDLVEHLPDFRAAILEGQIVEVSIHR